MVVIAFSGCDGSGKTTLALKFKEYLKSAGLKVEYRREFEYFILKYLLRVLGEKVERERKKFLGEIKSRSSLDELKYKVWPFLVWLDSNFEIAYLKIFSKRKVVILDRCIVDHLIGFEHPGYIVKQTRNRLLRFSIKPELIIVLDAKPEIMYARKKETHSYPSEFYKEQRGRYLEAAVMLKTPIVRTDNKTINESLNEAIIYGLYYSSRLEDLLLHLLSNPIDDIYNILQYISKFNIVEKNKINIKYLLVEASKNNVEIPTYERLYKIHPSYHIDSALKTIEFKYNNFIKILAEVADIFESTGINYVVFKTLPPYKNLPRDIDILVYEKDKSKAIESLKRRGFRISKTHVLHKEVSLKKNNIEIDLHWKVEWMGRRIIEENLVIREHDIRKFKEMSVDISISVPNPTHEFLLVVAHAILQHHYVTLSEVHYIRSLIKNFDLDWNFIFNKISKNSLLDNFSPLMSIIIAKDTLFYEANITRRMQKVEKDIMSSLKAKSISIPYTSLLKTVVWLSLKHSFSLNALSFIDFMFTIYRKLRYNLVGYLPYNVPLKEVTMLLEG